MKRVVFTILAAMVLVVVISACEEDTTELEIYEQSIDNEELKEDDV